MPRILPPRDARGRFRKANITDSIKKVMATSTPFIPNMTMGNGTGFSTPPAINLTPEERAERYRIANAEAKARAGIIGKKNVDYGERIPAPSSIPAPVAATIPQVNAEQPVVENSVDSGFKAPSWLSGSKSIVNSMVNSKGIMKIPGMKAVTAKASKFIESKEKELKNDENTFLGSKHIVKLLKKIEENTRGLGKSGRGGSSGGGTSAGGKRNSNNSSGGGWFENALDGTFEGDAYKSTKGLITAPFRAARWARDKIRGKVDVPKEDVKRIAEFNRKREVDPKFGKAVSDKIGSYAKVDMNLLNKKPSLWSGIKQSYREGVEAGKANAAASRMSINNPVASTVPLTPTAAPAAGASVADAAVAGAAGAGIFSGVKNVAKMLLPAARFAGAGALVAGAGYGGYKLGELTNEHILNPAAKAITGDESSTVGTALYDGVDKVKGWFGFSDKDNAKKKLQQDADERIAKNGTISSAAAKSYRDQGVFIPDSAIDTRLDKKVVQKVEVAPKQEETPSDNWKNTKAFGTTGILTGKHADYKEGDAAKAFAPDENKDWKNTKNGANAPMMTGLSDKKRPSKEEVENYWNTPTVEPKKGDWDNTKNGANAPMMTGLSNKERPSKEEVENYWKVPAATEVEPAKSLSKKLQDLTTAEAANNKVTDEIESAKHQAVVNAPSNVTNNNVTSPTVTQEPSFRPDVRNTESSFRNFLDSRTSYK